MPKLDEETNTRIFRTVPETPLSKYENTLLERLKEALAGDDA